MTVKVAVAAGGIHVIHKEKSQGGMKRKEATPLNES